MHLWNICKIIKKSTFENYILHCTKSDLKFFCNRAIEYLCVIYSGPRIM